MLEGYQLYDGVSDYIEYYRAVPHRVEIRFGGPDGDVDHAGKAEFTHQNRLDFTDEMTGDELGVRFLPGEKANRLFEKQMNSNRRERTIATKVHVTLLQINGDADV